jgi:hypothetical protein
MYLLGSNCNRAGLSELDTLQYCLEHFDLPEREIRSAVKSAYTHHNTEFAKFANVANLQNTDGENDIEEDFLKNTPVIPDEVYDTLPDILREGALAFTDNRKRDVFSQGLSLS